MRQHGRVLLGGDVHFEGAMDGLEPFALLQGVLASDDVVFANLEGCFFDGHDPYIGYQNYQQMKWAHADPRTAAALADGHLSAVGLANNVVMGGPPIRRTIETLDALGIAHTGAGMDLGEARAPAIVESRGVRYGFLQRTSIFWPFGVAAVPTGPVAIPVRAAYVRGATEPREVVTFSGAPGVATLRARTGYERSYTEISEAGSDKILHTWADPWELEQFTEDVRALRSQVDVLVTSHHWRLSGVSVGRDYRTEIAHAAIDAGADLVVAHGTHAMHEIEVYREKAVFYGLGEMFFRHGPAYGESWKTAPSPGRLLVRAEVRDKKIARVTARFLERPRPDDERLAVKPAHEFPWGVAQLETMSKRFGTALRIDGDSLVVVG
jgi:poly-gamma-glutamate capsule biosynthesis protein CapA/YwtB (metallophosphatase superfamily)